MVLYDPFVSNHKIFKLQINEKNPLFTNYFYTQRITSLPDCAPSITRHTIFHSQKSFDLGYDASRIIAGDTFARSFFPNEKRRRGILRVSFRYYRAPVSSSYGWLELLCFTRPRRRAALSWRWRISPRRFCTRPRGTHGIVDSSQPLAPSFWYAIAPRKTIRGEPREYGMWKNKFLLEQINLKSEKWAG